MPPDLLQGTFHLEFQVLPGERLRISYSLEGLADGSPLALGPIYLEPDEVNQLAALVDTATSILYRAHRQDGRAELEAQLADEEDERMAPLRTDPSALSRRRRPV
jgi:hypothetical protein